MRYIDADALKAKYDMGEDCLDCKTPVFGCQYRYDYTKMTFCEWLDDMPTADVREVKHGKWKINADDLFPVESTMECSVCHHEQPLNIDDNYCPNCGADMRGEEDEIRLKEGEAEQEGKWIDMNTSTTMYMPRYKCSICNEWANKSNFCPNCGADMRGES